MAPWEKRGCSAAERHVETVEAIVSDGDREGGGIAVGAVDDACDAAFAHETAAGHRQLDRHEDRLGWQSREIRTDRHFRRAHASSEARMPFGFIRSPVPDGQ